MKANSIAQPSCFIGVDVASKHLDVARHGQAQPQRIGNDEGSIRRWVGGVPRAAVLAMEATGRYHLRLAELAHAHGLRVYVLNPRDVKHYARAVGQRGKTDRLDALVLARYVAHEHAQLHAWQPGEPAVQRLQELLRRRAALVRHSTALRQSLQGETELLKAVLQPLGAAVAKLDKQIAQAATAVPNGAQALQHITSVPGLGLLNGAALLALFTRLKSAGADAVVAFTGLDPRPMESGNRRGQRRLSKRGPAELRRLLFNAAMSAARTPSWRALYERERAKNLPRTAALVVLARKLVRVAFGLFKTCSSFDSKRLSHNLNA
jgi:transposase